ncbi:hypothetical protein Nepgr_015836 [Nepenthes gracilis]|uniref:Uncharacterized protein n=1 Tax=Nepenthes gracilis TaxID=150966 RepID=A0AAD3XRZ8_NEPGR|nr:hypothetical protein Nepgr_015836 [Nepenthes gracilis]
MAIGSDLPLIEAVVSAPPSLVEGACNSVVSSPFDSGGVIADAPGVAECESGVIPRVGAPALTSRDQAGLDNGLPVAPSKCDSENSEYLEVAETNMEVGFPRIASCPAILQLYNQQTALSSVPSAGCKSVGISSQTLPPVALILMLKIACCRDYHLVTAVIICWDIVLALLGVPAEKGMQNPVAGEM